MASSLKKKTKSAPSGPPDVAALFMEALATRNWTPYEEAMKKLPIEAVVDLLVDQRLSDEALRTVAQRIFPRGGEGQDLSKEIQSRIIDRTLDRFELAVESGGDMDAFNGAASFLSLFFKEATGAQAHRARQIFFEFGPCTCNSHLLIWIYGSLDPRAICYAVWNPRTNGHLEWLFSQDEQLFRRMERALVAELLNFVAVHGPLISVFSCVPFPLIVPVPEDILLQLVHVDPGEIFDVFDIDLLPRFCRNVILQSTDRVKSAWCRRSWDLYLHGHDSHHFELFEALNDLFDWPVEWVTDFIQSPSDGDSGREELRAYLAQAIGAKSSDLVPHLVSWFSSLKGASVDDLDMGYWCAFAPALEELSPEDFANLLQHDDCKWALQSYSFVCDHLLKKPDRWTPMMRQIFDDFNFALSFRDMYTDVYAICILVSLWKGPRRPRKAPVTDFPVDEMVADFIGDHFAWDPQHHLAFGAPMRHWVEHAVWVLRKFIRQRDIVMLIISMSDPNGQPIEVGFCDFSEPSDNKAVLLECVNIVEKMGPFRGIFRPVIWG